MITVYYGEYPCEHFKAEIAKADADIDSHLAVGELIRSTGSGHYIQRLQQAVRCGLLRTDDLTLYCNDTRVDIDVKGQFVQPWLDELFEAAFYLIFHPYERPFDPRDTDPSSVELP